MIGRAREIVENEIDEIVRAAVKKSKLSRKSWLIDELEIEDEVAARVRWHGVARTTYENSLISDDISIGI